jgi:pantothenate kinase
MELPKTLNVTDQAIDISGLSDKQISYYQKLAEKIRDQYEEKGKGRQLYTLSGPPGSGKSVVTAILFHFFQAEKDLTYINLGLDAFHFPNAVLAERKLLDVKGRYDTYDTDLLLRKLSDFKEGEPVMFPYYSREDHNPVADKIAVTQQNILLMLEGQWLLRDASEWSNVRTLSEGNYMIEGPLDEMRDNVIRRHIRGGRTTEDAINFYTESDLKNSKEVLENSVKADETIKFYKNI